PTIESRSYSVSRAPQNPVMSQAVSRLGFAHVASEPTTPSPHVSSHPFGSQIQSGAIAHETQPSLTTSHASPDSTIPFPQVALVVRSGSTTSLVQAVIANPAKTKANGARRASKALESTALERCTTSVPAQGF